MILTKKQEDSIKGVVGINITQARLNSGLSREEVSRRLKMSTSYLYRVEYGKTAPGAAALKAFSELYGCSIGSFFDGIDDVLPRRIIDGCLI